MIREDIAHALPEGVGQPLWSQLLTRQGTKGWIRVGDIRRTGEDLHFEPLCPWDGPAFEVLWNAACSNLACEESGDRVVFGIRDNGRMQLLAEANLRGGARRDTASAWREGRTARRRLLFGSKGPS